MARGARNLAGTGFAGTGLGGIGFGGIGLLVGVAVGGGPPDGGAAAEGPESAPTFDVRVKPFLAAHCLGCHDQSDAKGSLALDDYEDLADMLDDRETWEIVARRVEAREMPPPGKPRPADDEVRLFVGWIRERFALADRDARRDPGRVTVRRLNRMEYANTVRDLLGVTFPAAEVFPSDDVGYGFDHIGDVLSLPPVLLERYLAAAERIAGDALREGSASRERILVCRSGKEGSEDSEHDSDDDARGCLRKILEPIASRAWRRPASPEDLGRLVDLAAAASRDETSLDGASREEASSGGAFEAGVRLALEAILVSPRFLFRVEVDPAPDDPTSVRELDGFELATRLSYFLWSSLPDDELFALAREGTLGDHPVLEAQVRRMLADPRSGSVVESFAPQWLQIRRLDGATPDPGLFPRFDDRLRRAMLRETELLFETVMREDRSVLDLLGADYTFLDARLARHYGIREVEGEEFRRVSLEGSPRRGVMAHGSVLTATSNPTRTSPVKRGKWVLEVLLGAAPPPPPPDVPDLSEEPEAVLSGTVRQRTEQHRADPACATCHQSMDPLGFGLENFDAVGAWREKDGDFAIDASGELPDGRSFEGPEGLVDVLLSRKEDFRRALSEAMLVYALGRGLETYDRPAVDGIVGALAEGGDRFSALILAVARSEPFRMRRGDPGGAR